MLRKREKACTDELIAELLLRRYCRDRFSRGAPFSDEHISCEQLIRERRELTVAQFFPARVLLGSSFFGS
jgi:hypothetical protein